MEFRIGDRVKFLNDKGEGKIIALPSPGLAIVEDESEFAFEHPLSELVPVQSFSQELKGYEKVLPDVRDMLERNIDAAAAKKAAADFNALYMSRSDRNKRADTMEVDLHIHALIDKPGSMENSEIIQIQLDHFERMIKIATEKKIPRLIFIHGVGQGVLRGELRKLLTNYYPNASFMDAPYVDYGYGATEVRIRTS